MATVPTSTNTRLIAITRITTFCKKYFQTLDGHPNRIIPLRPIWLRHLPDGKQVQKAVMFAVPGLQTALADLDDGRKLLILGWDEAEVVQEYNNTIRKQQLLRSRQSHRTRNPYPRSSIGDPECRRSGLRPLAFPGLEYLQAWVKEVEKTMKRIRRARPKGWRDRLARLRKLIATRRADARSASTE